MPWEVEYTDEFQDWWEGLEEDEQDSVAAMVQVLEVEGPMLPFPYSSGIQSSRHHHMRGLRIQHGGQPYRVLYAFDPRRAAICWSGVARSEATDGTRRWFQRLIGSTTGTCAPWKGRDRLMAKSFRKLLDKMPKERRDRIEARKRELIREVNLRELRQALELTQQQLAMTLRVNQAAISKMESQYDMYISTLRRFIRAMGGTLKIVVEFPGGEVLINQFSQEDEQKGARA